MTAPVLSVTAPWIDVVPVWAFVATTASRHTAKTTAIFPRKLRFKVNHFMYYSFRAPSLRMNGHTGRVLSTGHTQIAENENSAAPDFCRTSSNLIPPPQNTRL